MKKTNRYKKSITELQTDMDRVIGFVERYFTKTSISLGVWGVVISALLQEPIYLKLSYLFEYYNKHFNALSVVYFICTFLSLVVFSCGIVNFVLTLVAKAPVSKKDSRLFYADIAENKSISTFKRKIEQSTEEQVRDDYINQIYINSVLCREKNKRYNKGVYFSSVGFICFIISSIVFHVLSLSHFNS